MVSPGPPINLSRRGWGTYGHDRRRLPYRPSPSVGVRRIYGYPGDGINGVFGALQRAEGKFEFVQVRHEEMAAFMASAHAKFTGELGVCIATSGPGAAHLITGLYDARLDHMPVLAIAGQQARMALGGHYQQEVDLRRCSRTLPARSFSRPACPAQVRHMTDRAVRIATAGARVTAMVFPNDLQEVEYEEPPRATAHCIRVSATARPRSSRTSRSCASAAEVLNAGKKVAILVGAGALKPPTRSSRWPTTSAPALPRRCSARLLCPTTCPGSPALSACSAPSRAGI